MVEKVKIHGLNGVRKALRALPKEIRNRELRKALRPGARIIQDVARAMVPRNTGILESSIAIRTEKKRFLRDAARLRIGVAVKRGKKGQKNESAWYWRFVEFGTSKMAGRPFLVPAFEIAKYTADKAIKAALLKGVQRQAKRVKGR